LNQIFLQAFGVANDILSDREERLLPIRTYKVVPFSTRLGLIEFLADTTTYKDLCQPNDKRLPPVVIDNAAAFLKSLRGQKIGSDFLHFISKDLGGSNSTINFVNLEFLPNKFYCLFKAART